MKIDAKPPKDNSVLYVMGVKKENIQWLREESKRLGYRTNEYLNLVIDELKGLKNDDSNKGQPRGSKQ